MNVNIQTDSTVKQLNFTKSWKQLYLGQSQIRDEVLFLNPPVPQLMQTQSSCYLFFFLFLCFESLQKWAG